MASFGRPEAGVMQTDGVQTRATPVGHKLTRQCFLNKFLLEQCLLCSGGFFLSCIQCFLSSSGKPADDFSRSSHHILVSKIPIEQ